MPINSDTPKRLKTPAPTILAEQRNTYLRKIQALNHSTEREIQRLRRERTRRVANYRKKARTLTSALAASVKERLSISGATLDQLATAAKVPMTKVVAMLYNDALAPSEVATAVADASVKFSQKRGLRKRRPKPRA